MRRKTWILDYALQLLIALFAMLIGFGGDMVVDKYYYSTPLRDLALCSIFMGGLAGYSITRLRRQRAAAFVWIPALFLLLYTAYSLAEVWNPAWAHTSRVGYVWNSLVGPGCGPQECIYTIATDLFLSFVAYSIGARLAFMKLPRVRRAADQV